MTSGAYPQPRPDRVAAQRNREAAFSRIARVRGASILGAGALTAAVAGVVSAIAPGHTLGAKARARTAVASTPSAPSSRAPGASATNLPPLASPRSLGLRSPDTAPSSPAPTQPSAPSQQSAPAPQSAPTQPSAPTQQSAPAPSQGPVVSGGS